MDLQFHGANCISLTHKGTRVIIDDNLAALGAKSVLRPEDVALYTGPHEGNGSGRITFDGPGEYEVSDISIIGVAAQGHTDEANQKSGTIFKLIAGDVSVLVAGHINPELSEKQMETIGMVDLMFVPVGGHGYTVDPIGALKLIKEVEPKLVVPTHYDDKSLKFPVPQQELGVALKELAMEPKETVSKLKLKSSELSDLTQLIVLEKS
jgi:L-ascorbate metabolism protein UlaG (beta-lactamase superfamily)